MSSWNDCPDDLLISIFEHFDLKTRLKAAQVCQNWYRLSKDPRTKMDVASIQFQRCPCNEADIRFLKMVLENHLGKIGELNLFDHLDSVISSWISRKINDGRVRIDQLTLVSSSLGNFSLANYVDSILPSSIRELKLTKLFQWEILNNCDWSQFYGLQRLTLKNVLINPSTTMSLPLLKYLALSFNNGYDYGDGRLNEMLASTPLLEELRLATMVFDATSFRNFLLTINEKLPNLSKLRFENVNFDLSTGKVSEFVRLFNFPILKEFEFEHCDGLWIDIAHLFLQISSLDTIILSPWSVMGYMEDIYRLTPLIKEKKAKLIFFGSSEIAHLESLALPTELCNVLTTLSINTNVCLPLWPDSELPPPISGYLRLIFGCGSYENLTTIDFSQCRGLKDEILKLIAQSCPWLKFFNVWSEEITDNGLKGFLIFWHERRSQRLSILLKESFIMDGLFGTSITNGGGILEDGKRWMTLQKEFSMNDQKKGTRLIIWDQGNIDEGVDQKFLEISNYNLYKVCEDVTI